MRRTLLVFFTIICSATLFADNFITEFMNRYAEESRPLSNVNIGKAMLDNMLSHTNDPELKKALKELNSIQSISSENSEDSRYYFEKAHELIAESFSDYTEVASVNENNSSLSMFMKEHSEDLQDLILISLGEGGVLTLISMSGKIDFNTIRNFPIP